MDGVGNNRNVTMTVQVGDVTAPEINYANLNRKIDEGSTVLGYVTSNEPVTWSVEGDGISISNSGSNARYASKLCIGNISFIQSYSD